MLFTRKQIFYSNKLILHGIQMLRSLCSQSESRRRDTDSEQQNKSNPAENSWAIDIILLAEEIHNNSMIKTAE